MTRHKNARLTPVGRARAVARVLAGESLAGVAAGVGLSPRRWREWVRRLAWGGAAGLQDRSSRPHCSPRRLARHQRRQIARLRRARWSSLRIAEAVGIPVPTAVADGVDFQVADGETVPSSCRLRYPTPP